MPAVDVPLVWPMQVPQTPMIAPVRGGDGGLTLMIMVSCTLLLVIGVGLIIDGGGRPVRTPVARVRPVSGPETLASGFIR